MMVSSHLGFRYSAQQRKSIETATLLKLIREQPFRVPAKGQRKSTLKRSNRARPDVLDNFLMRFVLFYASRGQHAGKDPGSPCVRFVIAAAAPALQAAGFETKPGMISNLIRARAHTFNNLTAVSIETGAINRMTGCLTRHWTS